MVNNGFPQWLSGKESAWNAGDADLGSVPGLGRSPEGGNSNPLQYSCLENLLDRGAWWATVHRVAKSQTQLKWLSTAAAAARSPQSCLTLCDPMDGSPPGSSVHEILQARILEWVANSFPWGSFLSRDRMYVSCVSWTGRQILYHCATREAHKATILK